MSILQLRPLWAIPRNTWQTLAGAIAIFVASFPLWLR